MEQSITIKIAGKDYPLKATSPEMEQLMRLAADSINQKLAAYDAKFPDKTLVDKLSFVQKKLSSVNEEAKAMLSRTSAYLDNIDKK